MDKTKKPALPFAKIANPAAWYYAPTLDSETWFRAADRDEARREARAYGPDGVFEKKVRMLPDFRGLAAHAADNLLDDMAEADCWWEDGWEGSPDAAARAKLSDEFARVLVLWFAKNATLDGACLCSPGDNEIEDGKA